MTAKQKAFLGVYSDSGNITLAAAASKVSRRAHYDWLANDPEYVKVFEDARDHAADLMEAEARRRAVEGVLKPLTYRGGLQYEAKRDEFGELVRDERGGIVLDYDKPLMVREYSDTLLIFMLKAARPEKFRDSSTVEHTGKDGGPITVNVIFKKSELSGS